jgi:hypothetical protein
LGAGPYFDCTSGEGREEPRELLIACIQDSVENLDMLPIRQPMDELAGRANSGGALTSIRLLTHPANDPGFDHVGIPVKQCAED